MDSFERALAKIAETEDEIYADLTEESDIEGLRKRDASSLMDTLSATNVDIALDNFAIVSGAARKHD